MIVCAGCGRTLSYQLHEVGAASPWFGCDCRQLAADDTRPESVEAEAASDEVREG
jgi:hypothetical protein